MPYKKNNPGCNASGGCRCEQGCPICAGLILGEVLCQDGFNRPDTTDISSGSDCGYTVSGDGAEIVANQLWVHGGTAGTTVTVNVTNPLPGGEVSVDVQGVSDGDPGSILIGNDYEVRLTFGTSGTLAIYSAGGSVLEASAAVDLDVSVAHGLLVKWNAQHDTISAELDGLTTVSADFTSTGEQVKFKTTAATSFFVIFDNFVFRSRADGGTCDVTDVVQGDATISDELSLDISEPDTTVLSTKTAGAGKVAIWQAVAVKLADVGDVARFYFKWKDDENHFYLEVTLGSASTARCRVYQVQGSGDPTELTDPEVPAYAGMEADAWFTLAVCYGQDRIAFLVYPGDDADAGQNLQLGANMSIDLTTDISDARYFGVGTGAVTTLVSFKNFVYEHGYAEGTDEDCNQCPPVHVCNNGPCFTDGIEGLSNSVDVTLPMNLFDSAINDKTPPGDWRGVRGAALYNDFAQYHGQTFTLDRFGPYTDWDGTGGTSLGVFLPFDETDPQQNIGFECWTPEGMERYISGGEMPINGLSTARTRIWSLHFEADADHIGPIINNDDDWLCSEVDGDVGLFRLEIAMILSLQCMPAGTDFTDVMGWPRWGSTTTPADPYELVDYPEFAELAPWTEQDHCRLTFILHVRFHSGVSPYALNGLSHDFGHASVYWTLRQATPFNNLDWGYLLPFNRICTLPRALQGFTTSPTSWKHNWTDIAPNGTSGGTPTAIDLAASRYFFGTCPGAWVGGVPPSQANRLLQEFLIVNDDPDPVQISAH